METETNIKCFADAFKYLFNIASHINTLRNGSKKTSWFESTSEYNSLMINVFQKEKSKMIDDNKCLLKMKPSFLKFLSENKEVIDKKIDLDDEENFDIWINWEKSSGKKSSQISEKKFNGIVITQMVPTGNKNIIHTYKLPISKIYREAIELHKNETHVESDYPLRVIYGFLCCLKYCTDEECSGIDESIKFLLEEYKLEEEIKSNNVQMGDLGQLIGSFGKQLGIDMTDIPTNVLGQITPEVQDKFSKMAKKLIGGVKKSDKPQGFTDMFATIAEQFNSVEAQELIEMIGSSNVPPVPTTADL